MNRFIIDLILLPLSYFYIAIILKIASVWKKGRRISGETSRKFVHVMVGLIVIIMPIIFSTKVVPIFIASTFIIINFLTSPASPLGMFKLDAVSEGHNLGTTYYSISLTWLLWYYFSIPWLLQVGFLPLVIGDSSAAYFGLKYGKHQWKVFNDRSIEGSIAGFFITFVILGIVLLLYKQIDLFDFGYTFMFALILMTSFITMIVELISPKGFDNLTIPLFCTLFALFVS